MTNCSSKASWNVKIIIELPLNDENLFLFFLFLLWKILTLNFGYYRGNISLMLKGSWKSGIGPKKKPSKIRYKMESLYHNCFPKSIISKELNSIIVLKWSGSPPFAIRLSFYKRKQENWRK